MANGQVTKETTPAEISAIANQLEELLKKSSLPYDRTQMEADLKKRAADLNGETVAAWETRHSSAPPPAPKATKKTAKPVADVAEPVIPPGTDRREAVRQRLKGATAKVDPNYFWLSQENEAIGKTWVALRRDGGVVMNMMSVGPSGCGKTESYLKLGDLFKIPVYIIDCASITSPDKWVGHKEVITTENGPQTTYVMSEHLRWLSADGFEPGIVVYDEVNRLQPNYLNMLIPVLDGRQKIWVPDLGIYVNVHPDTMIGATANLGVGYSGTYGLDIAFHDRFGVIMEQTFPPQVEEQKILTLRTGIDDTRAERLVTVAKQCRQKANEGNLSKYVSTRALIDWARWVTTGMTMTEAAEATWVKKFSDDGGSGSERALVRLTLQGVCAGK